MTGTDPPPVSRSDSSSDVDPQRLTALVDQAVSLRDSGSDTFLDTVLKQLNETEREAYRQPILNRLQELGVTSTESELLMETQCVDPKAPVGHATIEPVGGFQAPKKGIELPPSVRHPVDAKEEAVPKSIGKFRIERELGRGAFGAVYLGFDEELQRNVAVKVSHVLDHQVQERLRIEAAKLAQIESIGIVPVYHIGTTTDDMVYLVEKYVEGSTLGDLLKRGPLSPAAAAILIREIALGLEPAHLQEILHRDLKPDNILIEGKTGRAWIADFGLAITEDEQHLQPHELAGTPPYMAPEQIKGRVDFLDPRSDIWALGVMYYEMLTGKLPFNGRDRQTLTEQICELDPRPVHQRAPGHLTEAMNEIFLRCCAKKPSDRFATVRELADALDILIANGLSDQNIHGDLMGSQIGESTVEYGSMGPRYRSTRGSFGQMSTRAESTLSSKAVSILGADTPRQGLSLLVYRLAAILSVIGLSIIGGIGYQMYSRSQADADGDSINASDAPGDLGGNALGSDATTSTVGSVDDALPADSPMNQNQMGPEQADGSRQKPFVVATDGSGSHRTISAAIAASPSAAFIRVLPGVFNEAIHVATSVTIEGQPELSDDGVAYVCELENSQQTPLTIDCPEGKVILRNFVIKGKGHRSTQEFNAIDVTGGTLVLDSCVMSTTSFNCIKVTNGSALGARQCEFLDSRDFAISTKDHDSVSVIDCTFRSSGVQLVGGTGTIEGGKFFGVIGVYVSRSSAPVSIQNCLMEGSHQYGIASTNGGRVIATDITMRNCKKGIWATVSGAAEETPGSVKLSSSRLEDCQVAIDVQGGVLEATKNCRVEACGIGIAISTGQVSLSDFSIAGVEDNGISVTDMADVVLKDCTIERCDRAAINMLAGKLTFQDGKIRDCKTNGIIFGDKAQWPHATASASLESVQFSGVESAGITAYSGPIRLTGVTFDGGQVGLYAEGPPVARPNSAPFVDITTTRTTFANQTVLGVFAKGDSQVTLGEGALSALSDSKSARALPPARVLEPDSL